MVLIMCSSDFTFKAYLGFMSDLDFRWWDLGLGVRELDTNLVNHGKPFRRHPKIHGKTLALRSQSALPRAAPPS